MFDTHRVFGYGLSKFAYKLTCFSNCRCLCSISRNNFRYNLSKLASETHVIFPIVDIVNKISRNFLSESD